MNVNRAKARRVGREFFRDDDIVRQVNGAARALGAFENVLRLAEQVILVERFPDLHPARGKEGVRHAAANDQMIDLADQVTQNGELGRHLGATNYRRNWPLGFA